MKKYLSKDRILMLFFVVFAVLLLAGCSGNKTQDLPLNKFTDETGPLAILVFPIAWLMHAIGSWFPTGQFAWGILFTTIIVRTIAWPIYAKTNDMSLKMAVAQPEIERLQAKYANRKDPQAQQRMQQEMMAIYKKHKISFTGCLMPLLQMPLFIAMYNVVRRITLGPITDELGNVTNAAKLALTDDSLFGIQHCLGLGVYGTNRATPWTSGAFWVGVILSIIVGGTMLLLNIISQKQPKYAKKKVPTQNKNNQMMSTMKIMNYVMIIMMVFMALSNNGLALYWVVGNVYSIAQTLVNRKLNEIKYEKMSSDVDRLIG